MTLFVSSKLIFINICLALSALVQATQQDDNFQVYSGVSPAEILRARGFQADEMFLATSSGYRLRITRGRNPLISNDEPDRSQRDPVLFVHGITLTSNIFLINSSGATPKDFTRQIPNLAKSELRELNELLANEPSAKSLPLLALNFGHEIWMLDRRGAPGSRQLVNPTGGPPSPQTTESPAPNPIARIYKIFAAALDLAPRQQVAALEDPGAHFWNYSLDEQAREDFPQTVEFVLTQTGRSKLALVTHSAGGPIALMAQTLYPEKLSRQISSAIYWAPAYSLSQNTPFASAVFTLAQPFLERYIGPVPSPFVSTLVQAYLRLVCSSPLAQATVCRAGMDLIAGKSLGADRARPEFVSNFLFPSSSRELAQMPQVLGSELLSLRRYDYGREGNLRAYGSHSPPAYNLSRLQCRPHSSSIYVGATDALVSVADVRATSKQVRVPHKLHVIDAPGGFGHDAFFFGDEAPRRAVIPSMQELQTLAAAAAA